MHTIYYDLFRQLSTISALQVMLKYKRKPKLINCFSCLVFYKLKSLKLINWCLYHRNITKQLINNGMESYKINNRIAANCCLNNILSSLRMYIFCPWLISVTKHWKNRAMPRKMQENKIILTQIFWLHAMEQRKQRNFPCSNISFVLISELRTWKQIKGLSRIHGKCLFRKQFWS